MNKVLKIGGIILGSIVALVIIIIIFSLLKNVFFGMPGISIFETKKYKESSLSDKNSAIPGASSSGLIDEIGGVGTSFNKSNAYSSTSTESSYYNNSSQNLLQTDKKVIKNGNMSLKVDKADEAAEKISRIAKSYGGEVFSSNFYQSGSNIKSGIITVKVPVSNFEKAFDEIKTVASLVIQESTSGQDVTEQYVDLQAQLRNSQAEEQSFLKILDQAEKIQDILDVTREISRVRGTIEQLQTRIRYLDSQTDMSTISVSISEDANITVVDSWRPLQVVKDSFNALVRNLQGFIDSLIRIVIVIIPFLIIWALIIWIVYKIGKKIYLKIKNRAVNK